MLGFFAPQAMFMNIVLYYVLYTEQSYLICNFMRTMMSSVYFDNIVITHKKTNKTFVNQKGKDS